MQERKQRIQLFLKKILELSKTKKIWIYPAGLYGRIMGNFLKKQKIPVEGFIDEKKRNADFNKFSWKILSPEHISADAEHVYLIASTMYSTEIEKVLRKKQVCEKNRIVFDSNTLLDDLVYEEKEPDLYLKKLHCFRNCNRDLRCFIIGNGPSLCLEDLSRLKHEYSLAANKIFQVYDKTEWRPTYYFCEDVKASHTYLRKRAQLEFVLKHCQAGFTSIKSSLFDRYKDDNRFSNLYFYHKATLMAFKMPPFSKNCANEIAGTNSVSYTMLQFAAYMGFAQIYLLGMDHSFSMHKNVDGTVVKNGNIRNHSELLEESDFSQEYIPEYDRYTLGFKAAKIFADRHNIQIYNATRGGKLEVFKRVNFDSLFK